MNKLAIKFNAILFEAAPAAVDVLNSKPVTGTVALLNDASKAIMLIAPILAGLAIGVCALFKMGADEQDAPRWKKRMGGIVIALVIVFSASAIIALITHYYQ